MQITYTVSARGKVAAEPIQLFIKSHFAHIPTKQIESFFGFVEPTTLYGGRIFYQTELSAYDLRSLYEMNINLRLPLTNHFVTREEYDENLPFLDKYHRPGNAAIVTNDDLAKWIKEDFPDYRVEASVIKNIDNLRKIEKASKLYEIMILPMSANNEEKFLTSIEDKSRITLFANAGCALTCPAKICYTSTSKANKTGDGSLFACSSELKYREQIGMVDFDLDYLQSLGFASFKLLRSKPFDLTGY